MITKYISISGICEAIGWLTLGLALLLGMGMPFQEPVRIPVFAILSLSGFLSGVLLLAFAEILRRLREIVDQLRRITGAAE